jgi:hypothetical protein
MRFTAPSLLLTCALLAPPAILGAALPADGGGPGKAYRACLDAIAKPDKAGIIALCFPEGDPWLKKTNLDYPRNLCPRSAATAPRVSACRRRNQGRKDRWRQSRFADHRPDDGPTPRAHGRDHRGHPLSSEGDRLLGPLLQRLAPVGQRARADFRIGQSRPSQVDR